MTILGRFYAWLARIRNPKQDCLLCGEGPATHPKGNPEMCEVCYPTALRISPEGVDRVLNRAPEIRSAMLKGGVQGWPLH